MARDSAPNQYAAGAAPDLKAIRERVVVLEKRLREASSLEAVSEIQKEVEYLIRVLTGLAEGSPTASPEPWPRDLNAEPAAAIWGSDPEGLRRG